MSGSECATTTPLLRFCYASYISRGGCERIGYCFFADVHSLAILAQNVGVLRL